MNWWLAASVITGLLLLTGFVMALVKAFTTELWPTGFRWLLVSIGISGVAVFGWPFLIVKAMGLL